MGRRLSDAEETKNIGKLTDFRDYWRDSPEYPPENRGNNHIQYPVDVTYTWRNGQSNLTFTSTFRAFVGSGPEDDKVDIDDTATVQVEHFHLHFSPAFQKYDYDGSDHSLIISDTSSKMGGSYHVRIRPNIEEP